MNAKEQERGVSFWDRVWVEEEASEVTVFAGQRCGKTESVIQVLCTPHRRNSMFDKALQGYQWKSQE